MDMDNSMDLYSVSGSFSARLEALARNLATWRKTGAGASVECWPAPESELEAFVSFAVEEAPPAEGVKSPSNPSTFTAPSAGCTLTHCETSGIDETAYQIRFGGLSFGCTVDAAQGIATVTRAGKIFDGTEDFSVSSASTQAVAGYVYDTGIARASGASATVCSHYAIGGSLALGTYLHTTAGRLVFCASPSDIASVEDFQNWVASQMSAGTPLTVVWTLAEPLVLQIGKTRIYALPQIDKYTPRRNTVSVSAGTVNVGYMKSPIQAETDLTNAIISLGGNI